MAVGCRQGIGGIEVLLHLLGVQLQYALQHARHLFLRRTSVARQSHLYLHGGIFVDGHIVLYGSRNGHALCTSQLQHRLHVFAEERRLDGQFVGQVLADDARDAFVDVSQFQVRVAHLVQVYDAQCYGRGLVAHDAQHPVPHQVRARVDAHDNLFTLHPRPLISLP